MLGSLSGATSVDCGFICVLRGGFEDKDAIEIVIWVRFHVYHMEGLFDVESNGLVVAYICGCQDYSAICESSIGACFQGWIVVRALGSL